MKLQFITLSLLAISITACSKQERTDEVTSAADTQITQTQTEQLPLGDTSRTSLDWNGTYSGITPCASCEGINTVLTLKLDNTYVLETSYLGEEEAGQKPKVFTEAGNFEWSAAGNTISLMGDASQQTPKQFLVGENQLFMLDKAGKRITGALADKYRLPKQPD